MRRTMAMSVGLLSVVALGGCSDDGNGNLDAFCATARRFAVDNPADALGAYDPADPAGAARLLRQAADELDAWAGQAPSDVRSDVEELSDAAAALADAFEAATVDPARVAELERSGAEVEDASARVTEATRARCSVDLDVPTPTTATG